MIIANSLPRVALGLAVVCGFVAVANAQNAPTETYEDPPTLSAKQILRPEYLEGAHFHVLDEVPTYSGANQYTITSDYGSFIASGNELLVERVREIEALGKLDKVKESDEFTKALKKASTSPLLFARNLAKEPVQTVTGVPKGIWRMMNRVGDGLKGAGEKIAHRDEDQPKDPYDEGVLKNVSGFPQAKRDLANRLGVDPYSTNELLQKELNRLAWTSVGGSCTLDLLMMPIGGGAGKALGATYFVSDLDDDLREFDPAKLKKRNAARLRELGVGQAASAAFLASTVFSPTRQTAFVTSLTKLGKPANVEGFVELATDADSEADAVFYQRTAAVMAKLAKNGTNITGFGVLNNIPICVTADGATVVALEWDYAAWTPMGERFINALTQVPAGPEQRPVRIAVSGVVSDRVRQELANRKIELQERVLSGPLIEPATATAIGASR